MYGTVKDLCSRLPEQYWPDQRVTLIIWTEDDAGFYFWRDNI